MGTRAAARAKRQARRKKLAATQSLQAHSGDSVVLDEPLAQGESATFATAVADASESPPLPPAAAQLSPKQQIAVAALVLGGNVTRTAEQIGVDRRTIQRWMKDDPQFYEVLEGMRSELVVCARQNLLELAECSADMVETIFAERPCPRLALDFMRGLGVIGPAASEAIYQAPHVQIDLQAELVELENDDSPKSATLDRPAATSAQTQPVCPKSASDVQPLSPAQQSVLESLSQGETIADSAAKAHVSEAEVRHWLRSHGEFCLQLGELQIERLFTLRGKLFKLMRKALDILRTAVLSGNGRIALALLRGLGMMK